MATDGAIYEGQAWDLQLDIENTDETPYDLTNATEIKVNYKEPMGTVGSFDPSSTDTDSIVYQFTGEETSGKPGNWNFQAAWKMDGRQFYAKVKTVAIQKRLQ